MVERSCALASVIVVTKAMVVVTGTAARRLNDDADWVMSALEPAIQRRNTPGTMVLILGSEVDTRVTDAVLVDHCCVVVLQ